ncbi:hypothetical protein KUTeg_012314 [Tegillarca granosa]|uniref:Uncharacterized protein n=1 Tax=Tegillarca granosa TaxID=220873 RepID=A0ABQ9EZ54_TEGGR|nr:hypothetical protein KUTeg_012314 [Tegillarca granosa]
MDYLLQTSQDSTSSVIRRRKSPSPRPERPKSEISVRWADLVETTEITPVKRREGSQNLKNKPRPISDLEDNIEFFDEMYGDVIDDFQSFTGGSSLSPDMKSSFGSQISLQPYSSLQNLEKLKRQDSFDSKPCKRRMSTPHPIKSRQKQSTPKQKKQQHTMTPLVRSHSMPESLDKLHKKKKYITLGSSNLHGEGFLHHGEDDSSSDDGSDISIDRMSLYEKTLSARSSNIQLATLDEVS